MTYVLMHGPTLHAQAPYTFFLPHPSLIGAIRVGDLALLGFGYGPSGEMHEAERMWVEVGSIDGEQYAGRLVNQPDDPSTGVQHGDNISFTRDNILNALLVDQSRLPDIVPDDGRYPHIPEEREYWDGCLVDDCVLYERVPVEYLYRQEPVALASDEHVDSGWRIRGLQASATDKEMDERKVSLVALGAVLNRDDSWLHLIDAPVGSAFMRDFESNTYQPVTSP